MLSTFEKFHAKICNFPPYMIGFAILCVEFMFCTIIILKVNYTEIDWIAYMEEVEGWLGGETNYMNLKGPTGPLVYPAAFLYIFNIFRLITNNGKSIRKAQWLFSGIYILNLAIVLYIYKACFSNITSKSKSKSKSSSVTRSSSSSSRSSIRNRSGSKGKGKGNGNGNGNGKIKKGSNVNYDSVVSSTSTFWLMCIPMLILSKRLHSIFLLRLFNDPVAIIFGYVAITMFINYKYRIGCIFYSISVGIKMNMLLYAPGLLLILLLGNGIYETIICLFICFIIQVIIGYPFLSTYPIQYIKKAFEFNRIFFYKWTVNYKFLTEEIFLNQFLSKMLLLLTIITLIIFAMKWIKENMKVIINNKRKKENEKEVEKGFFTMYPKGIKLNSYFIVITIFTSNFIGITFARTIHYQFYSWYYHTIPLLLYHGSQGFKYKYNLVKLQLNPEQMRDTATDTDADTSTSTNTNTNTDTDDNDSGYLIPTYVHILCILISICIEISYNTYPAQPWSSLLLQVSHILILLGLYFAPAPLALASASDNENENKNYKKTS
jgi:alpha-1,3-mannosyltransferase